jgi:PPOX class probable F420-dependent enzyme
MSAFENLAKSRYVSLETYRKNGTGVQTPVWVARDGANLVVFTNGDSYKVKRLRRNPKLRIAECGVRGALKGPWHEATARLVEDPAEKDSAIGAIRAKYGWQMTLADLGARLGGTKKNWTVIAIRLSDDE